MATTLQSQAEQVRKIINQAIAKLRTVTDELAIKKITTESWESLEKLVANKNTFRVTRSEFRKAIEQAFPTIEELTPGYYLTSAGKGKEERYEHLALWYATTNKERWEVVGDAARAQYFQELPPLPPKKSPTLAPTPGDKTQQPEQLEQVEPQSQQLEQVEPKPQPQPEVKPVLELEDMTIESLKLDTETQGMVESAIAQSGMSLAEFIQQACRVYAKTVTGKTRKHSEDLSVVDSETLRRDKAYSTHPGRAEELVKRAIQAIKYHNGQSTELNQKWLITQSLLVDMTGAKAVAVKNAMGNYQTDIDSHNKVLTEAGATSLLNRKGELKEDFCDEWVSRFPSGLD